MKEEEIATVGDATLYPEPEVVIVILDIEEETETFAVPEADSNASLSKIIISLNASVRPLPTSSANSGNALFT